MIFNDNLWYRTPIKDEWIVKGKEEQEKLQTQNYGRKTVEIFKDRDVMGVIGREIFKEWREVNNISALVYEFDDFQYGDEGDLNLGGLIGDIKNKHKRENWKFYLRGDNATVFDWQIDKVVDFYIFTGWEMGNKQGYVFGWCPRSYFLRYNFHIPKGQAIGKWKAEGSHELELQRLFPISELSVENINFLNEQNL